MSSRAPTKRTPGLDFIGGRNPANDQPLVPALGQVLEQVALLESRGVSKIVLVDHAQDFTGDPLSTRDLHGIDVIITTGWTGFTARAEATGPFNRLRPGDRALGEYPGAPNRPRRNAVLIVNSDRWPGIRPPDVGFDTAVPRGLGRSAERAGRHDVGCGDRGGWLTGRTAVLRRTSSASSRSSAWHAARP